MEVQGSATAAVGAMAGAAEAVTQGSGDSGLRYGRENKK